MTSATEEEEKKEEEVEQMDDAGMPVTDKDKVGGPSTGEGSGLPA